LFPLTQKSAALNQWTLNFWSCKMGWYYTLQCSRWRLYNPLWCMLSGPEPNLTRHNQFDSFTHHIVHNSFLAWYSAPVPSATFSYLPGSVVVIGLPHPLMPWINLCFCIVIVFLSASVISSSPLAGACFCGTVTMPYMDRTQSSMWSYIYSVKPLLSWFCFSFHCSAPGAAVKHIHYSQVKSTCWGHL